MVEGYFIAFEGADGVGKTTQIDMLKRYLENNGATVSVTSMCSSLHVGEVLQKINQQESFVIDERVKSLLYAADILSRYNDIIHPALQRGEVVIADRYYLSLCTYAVARGVSLEWVKQINANLLLPNQTILLDSRPELSVTRKNEISCSEAGFGTDMYDQDKKTGFVNFQMLVKHLFLKLSSELKNVKIIDGTQPPNNIFNQVLETLAPRFIEMSKTT